VETRGSTVLYCTTLHFNSVLTALLCGYCSTLRGYCDMYPYLRWSWRHVPLFNDIVWVLCQVMELENKNDKIIDFAAVCYYTVPYCTIL